MAADHWGRTKTLIATIPDHAVFTGLGRTSRRNGGISRSIGFCRRRLASAGEWAAGAAIVAETSGLKASDPGRRASQQVSFGPSFYRRRLQPAVEKDAGWRMLFHRNPSGLCGPPRPTMGERTRALGAGP